MTTAFDVGFLDQNEDSETTTYPSAWCRISLKLEGVGEGDPDALVQLEYVPLKAKVIKNDFRQADTFEVTIDFEDFPFHPRIIEGGTCSIFFADVEELDIGFWRRQGDLRPYAQIAGVIDQVKTGIGEDGRETMLKGRDYTAYFLDVPATADPVAYTDPSGRKLTMVEVLESIIQARDLTKNIGIRNRDSIEPLYPADYKLTKRVATSQKTAPRRKKQGEVVWEILTEIALEAGHILYVDLDEIVVRPPNTIFVDGSSNPDDWYRFTLGEDLHEFKQNRRMGRQQGINVRCISYLDDEKRTLTSNYPKNPLQATKSEIPATSINEGDPDKATAVPSVSFRPFVFRGITSQSQLDYLAEQIYLLVQHHEVEGEFSTGEMKDTNGRSVWGIRYGDPVTIDLSDSLRSIATLSVAEQIQRLVDDTGMERMAAQAISNARAAATVPFYFHQVTMEFDAQDRAFSMSAEIKSRRQVDTNAAIAASKSEMGERLGDGSAEA